MRQKTVVKNYLGGQNKKIIWKTNGEIKKKRNSWKYMGVPEMTIEKKIIGEKIKKTI